MQGSSLTNKYAEGYPGARYYAGCEFIDRIENIARDELKQLFNCRFANVQPHSGASANLAVFFALLKPNDTILGMSLNSGGHLTHGAKPTISGKYFNTIQYEIDENGFLDYKEIENLLYKNTPRLLIVGASAYSREIDFEKIKIFLDNYNLTAEKKCYYMVDMAHIAGLVATNNHMSPIPYADVITSTTHKTLRGPRGGIILTNNEELAKKIDKAVFPGCQGGPLEHIIAAKAVCFYEALQDSFRIYIDNVLKNMKVFEGIFKENSINMVSAGTDNHLILVDLSKNDMTGRELEQELQAIGIICNKNAVKDDTRSKTETSGIRIGTAAITTRGAGVEDCKNIANIIVSIINHTCDKEKSKKIVEDFCEKNNIYK